LFLEDARLPQLSELVYLDTETTGLVGGTGTCAFLIGLGAAEGSRFVVRQFFLRDYPEEKAMLAALAEVLEPYQGLVTFNGKTFDIPLLETRYALARMKSPFARLLHLDVLHPARRLWRLRLETCELTHLERELLEIRREGDVAGSEIPGLYFDYLRTGDARGLQPVFYHNALDIVTLAALAVELAGAVAEVGAGREVPSLDLFSLSRIFDRVGAREKSVSTCQRALAAGLPSSIETRALWHLACQHKRQRQHEMAADIWMELSRREPEFAIRAYEELAIHYEHRRRDFHAALRFAESALDRLRKDSSPAAKLPRFTRRLERLRKKSACTPGVPGLPLADL
jgi:tetratricopeptide (TPR) repeat protein